MRNIAFICILVGSMVIAGSAGAQERTAMPKYEPLRLSLGKRFPASQHRLLRLRDRPDKKAKAEIRAHAWDLFAGLTRKSAAKESPIWDTWYTKCDLGLANCGTKFLEDKLNLHRSLRNFEVPAQSLEELHLLSPGSDEQSVAAQLSSGAFQKRVTAFAIKTRAHPQFASIIFNQEAADAIRKQCLYARGVPGSIATAACPPLPAKGKIKEFKRGAVALKTFWELVIADASGIGTLDTWKQDLWKNIQNPNDDKIIEKFRISKVRVDTKSTAECENRDYGDDEIVPLKCFYAIQLTQEDVDALNASPPRLVSVRDTGIAAGNYLVLVAVHVTTKEIPDWVWATFWWDRHGVSDCRAAGRPKTIKARWSHFLMETTLSGTTPLETDGGPKISFNPYLETSIPNGAISNCLQCHSKAAYGPPPHMSPYDLGVMGRDGKTLASGKNPDPHYLDNRVQTDFIWSVANSLNSNDVQPLMRLFQQNLHDLQLQELQLGHQENAPPPKQ